MQHVADQPTHDGEHPAEPDGAEVVLASAPLEPDAHVPTDVTVRFGS